MVQRSLSCWAHFDGKHATNSYHFAILNRTLVLGAGSLSKLPTSIGECVQLERFQVVSPPYTSNGLEGELVTEIGRLTKLRYVT